MAESPASLVARRAHSYTLTGADDPDVGSNQAIWRVGNVPFSWYGCPGRVRTMRSIRSMPFSDNIGNRGQSKRGAGTVAANGAPGQRCELEQGGAASRLERP